MLPGRLAAVPAGSRPTLASVGEPHFTAAKIAGLLLYRMLAAGIEAARNTPARGVS
jgi:hypothetical protein